MVGMALLDGASDRGKRSAAGRSAEAQRTPSARLPARRDLPAYIFLVASGGHCRSYFFALPLRLENHGTQPAGLLHSGSDSFLERNTVPPFNSEFGTAWLVCFAALCPF